MLSQTQQRRARRHQREVTRQQVLHKRMEAEQRLREALSKCAKASSEVEYDLALDDARKAASDFNTWGMVLPAYR